VRLKPNFADAHFNYGIALAKARRFAEAVEELRTTLKLQPSHPYAAKALDQATRSAAREAGK
jgi:Flp pilus assembly protein TadD